MMQVEDRNVFVWLAIMLAAWLLFNMLFISCLLAFVGLTIVLPLADEANEAFPNVQDESNSTADQIEAFQDMEGALATVQRGNLGYCVSLSWLYGNDKIQQRFGHPQLPDNMVQSILFSVREFFNLGCAGCGVFRE
ncbi:MAG: hypothetical protein QGG73_12830 [Candidatus Hydrogenedentes bacterium]|jgi:hypothetical protein|nr:hypothetical protein [Candidatus Hydrogenedentota bacterium]